MHNHFQNKKSGFVILFTALISTIVLAIALGIANLSFREVLLSSSARDGEFAFFAADTGAECALYWDIRQVAFGSTLVVPSCHTGAVDMRASSSPFEFRFDTGESGCAVVTVDKNDPTVTKIESLGYNVPCATLDIVPLPPRLVERAIRVTYGPGEAPDPNPNPADTATRGPADVETALSNVTPATPVAPSATRGNEPPASISAPQPEPTPSATTR